MKTPSQLSDRVFLLKLCGIPDTHRKGSLLLQKLYKSTLSKFHLCHLQSGLLWEASGISYKAPLGNKVSTALKCSVLPPDY